MRNKEIEQLQQPVSLKVKKEMERLLQSANILVPGAHSQCHEQILTLASSGSEHSTSSADATRSEHGISPADTSQQLSVDNVDLGEPEVIHPDFRCR